MAPRRWATEPAADIASAEQGRDQVSGQFTGVTHREGDVQFDPDDTNTTAGGVDVELHAALDQAENPTLDRAGARELAAHPDPLVRVHLAWRHDLTDVPALLAGDPDIDVRAAVVDHPACPAGLARDLLTDPDVRAAHGLFAAAREALDAARSHR